MIKLGNNNVSKIYLGAHPISMAYLGNNPVFQQGSQPQPTMIPYIRGGADGSYIDTGITADSTTRVIVWARNWNPVAACLFGSRVSSASSQYMLNAAGGNVATSFNVHFGGNTTRLGSLENLCHYHKYDLNRNSVYIDDVLVGSASASTFSSNTTIHLFGFNNNGTHVNMSLPADISAVKIYKNDALVRDFVAVNSPSVGLYDSVSDSLFTNDGTGSFIYGTFSSNAYTPLEYIECTNQQYFDTGIYGTGSLPAVVKFMVLGTDISNPTVFGSMTSGVSDSFFVMQIGNSSYKNRACNFYIASDTGLSVYNSNSSRLTNREVVFVKTASSAMLYENYSAIGNEKSFSVSSSWASPDTLAICTGKLGGTMSDAIAFNGYIYYAGFGTERNYVPAKVRGVAGMYDTYNDVFKSSESGVAFIAGPEV